MAKLVAERARASSKTNTTSPEAALTRSGRHSEALAVYRERRRVLRDELGLEPSRELRDLEAAMLRQDAELAPPATAGASVAQAPAPATDRETPTVARRRWCALLVACGAAIAVAAAALAGVLATRGSSGGLPSFRPRLRVSSLPRRGGSIWPC
jgi:transcriptional activator